MGGAMLTGMREAIRALRMMKGDLEEVASLKASQADTSTAKKRRQVTYAPLLILPPSTTSKSPHLDTIWAS